ncbi:MAG: hypothetical protein J6V44_00565 [Methanobrevibacter sp.]|nr:hypothetical protein [Methanobrevibacter sp.]
MVIFSNGIYLEKVIPYLNKNFTCLLNLNEPNIIGESNWNKILFNLEQLKANGKIKFVNLGINLYPDIKDYEYILKAAKRYYKTNVRCSFVAPTCDYTHVNKDEYYKQAKIIFLDFMNKAKEYGVKVRLDCNHVPECYFSEEELEEFKKYIENWHPVCHPVVDITADMKATACFGSYDPVDINQFENLSELTEYLQNEKMCPLQEKNSSGNCSFCEKFKDKSCQGGCLAFAKYNN